MHNIMMGCPVHNRAWVLPLYLKYILSIDYPKKNITLCFILNDSHDESQKILENFKYNHIEDYNDIIIRNLKYNMPDDIRQCRVSRKVYQRLAWVRNEFISNVKDEDYVMSIDSDILVPPNILKELIAQKKDIISALLFNDPSMRYPNILLIENGLMKHYFEFPKDSVFEVDITGAVYLIKSKICKRVKYGYDKYGEDIPFCISAKKLGYKIWCNSSVSCRHIMYPYMLTQKDKMDIQNFSG